MPISDSLSSGVVLLIGLILLIFIVIIIRQSLSASHYLRLLNQISDQAGKQAYRVVETDKPAAWCAGIWQPKIYVTRGLLNQLDEAQLSLVLAHESNHASNRDNLRKSLLHWSTLHWPEKLKQMIRHDFLYSIEISSDLAAVIHQQQSETFEQTIELLGSYSSREAGQTAIDVRKEALRHEIEKLKKMSNTPSVNSWLKTLSFLAVWGIAILLIAHIMHPVLELLSR